jgi:hypothetical protein
VYLRHHADTAASGISVTIWNITVPPLDKNGSLKLSLYPGPQFVHLVYTFGIEPVGWKSKCPTAEKQTCSLFQPIDSIIP